MKLIQLQSNSFECEVKIQMKRDAQNFFECSVQQITTNKLNKLAFWVEQFVGQCLYLIRLCTSGFVSVSDSNLRVFYFDRWSKHSKMCASKMLIAHKMLCFWLLLSFENESNTIDWWVCIIVVWYCDCIALHCIVVYLIWIHCPAIQCE